MEGMQINLSRFIQSYPSNFVKKISWQKEL